MKDREVLEKMSARFTINGTKISENWSIFILIKSYQDIHFWKALEILHMDLFLVFVSDAVFCLKLEFSIKRSLMFQSNFSN